MVRFSRTKKEICSMLTSIEYQGYTITAPAGPSDQGSFTSNPTPVQIVSQVDQQLVYTEPLTYDVAMRQAPANELIWGTVTFQCYWDTIFNAVAQDTEVNESVTYTTGVTTSDSDTKAFGMTFGVEGDLLPGIKAALGASFSQSETHSVEVSESRAVTWTYKALPGTTVQIWQLHADYIAEFQKDGTPYRNKLSVAGSAEDGLVLALTFPETAAAAA
jgi:hypothetical protein